MAPNSRISLTDTPLYRLTNTLARWAAVSCLWLVCSLPLLTLGAATKAALAVFTPAEDSGTVKKFFRAFRNGFLRITGLWLLIALLELLLGMDILFYRQLSRQGGAILAGIVLLLGNFLLNFQRFACFCAEGAEPGFRALLKRTAATMAVCLPAVGIATAMDLAAATALIKVPYLLFLIVILPGLFADIHSRLIRSFLSRCSDGQ